MPILSARGLARAYGTHAVLSDASLSVEAGERIGLVGRNGSGKTTLARILAGTEDPDAGEIVRATGLRVDHLEQEPRFAPGVNAVEAVLAGLGAWAAAIEQHREASEAIERGDGDLDRLLSRQSEAAARVDELGGWEKRHEAEAMLSHVGITDLDAELETMSGGERRRVALARVLLADPDLAVLDEPTNHLDVDAIEWLEKWLAERFRGALLLVTHDRYLLDRIVTRTLEVEDGRVHAYDGGWGSYLEAKAEREAHAERAEANRRNFLRRELEWLRRSPQARTTKQKARVDRAEAALAVNGPRRERDVAIEMGHVRSGKTILDVEDLGVDVGGRTLVEGLTLALSKGDRVGIIGPNGCGKTSLLRVLTEQAAPARGRVTLGKNTRIAFLDQNRSGLADDDTIFDAVAEGRGRIQLGDRELEVRSYLERFLFSSHEQRKRIGSLSGGERARVALARTLRDGANLVVLDEPTNDLDATTLAALEDALLDYPGTVLIVTHDRWLLDRVATSVLVFEGEGRVVRYPGGYASYLSLRQPVRPTPSTPTPESTPPPSAPHEAPASAPRERGRKLTYAEQIELDGLLDRVDAAEREVAQLEQSLGRPGFYELPPAQQRETFERLEQARVRASQLAERWTALEERRDGD